MNRIDEIKDFVVGTLANESAAYPNIDKIVYSLTVGDIAFCIAEVLGEKAMNISVGEIEDLISKGIDAIEYAMVEDTIKWGI